jgi:hypothetical protein
MAVAGVSFRTTWFPVSHTMSEPSGARAMPWGELNRAACPGPFL